MIDWWNINVKLLFVAILFLISCNNPLHRTYSASTYESDMEAIRKSDKVSDEDAILLTQYIVLAKLAGNSVEGKTYDDLLDKIKNFQQKTSELSAKETFEKEAKRKRLYPLLEVNLLDKTFTKLGNKNVIAYTVSFKNTGRIKIKTIQGKLVINDLMEKPVTSLNVLLDEDIMPERTLRKIYKIDYNDSDENDRRMRSKDLFDIRAVWDPEKIIFDNGQLAQ